HPAGGTPLDQVLVHVAQLALLLLIGEELLVGGRRRIPAFAGAERRDRLGEELVAHLGERIETAHLELAASHWPIAPIARAVAQVLIMIDGPGEHALARRDDVAPAVRRSVLVARRGEEGLRRRALSAV